MIIKISLYIFQENNRFFLRGGQKSMKMFRQQLARYAALFTHGDKQKSDR